MPNDMNIAFGDARRGFPDCRPAPVCDPRPVCPACGGLECLCRPRFFAGQLLSEEDLNRLDHYIVAKNRLHNRYLFGSGVVCGLEVVCGTCDPAGGVVVNPGYALSPCGNDIVVCAAESVNVCDLIDRCRPRGRDDCLDPHAPNPEECDYGDEEWVLAICYREKPSRGITALRGASCGCGGGKGGCGCGGKGGGGGCGCGCGGGGGSGGGGAAAGRFAYGGAEASCGCGGGGGAATKAVAVRATAASRQVAPQCEPTLVCEGYTFAVYKEPTRPARRPDPGALIRRFICCLQPLMEQLAALPAGNASEAERQAWLQSLLATAREFLAAEGLYDCDAAARLAAVPIPVRGIAADEYLAKWDRSTLSVFEILAAILQKCLCAALLPPCPPAEMNDCVPIATVTVSRGKCRVRRVCNIGHRRFLLTFPTLRYWLSWLPMFGAWSGAKTPTIRDLIEAFCCTPVSRRYDFAAARVDLHAREGVREAILEERRGEFREEFREGVDEDVGEDMPRDRPEDAEPFDAAAGGAPFARARAGTTHPFTRLLAEAVSGAPEVSPATLLLAAMGARNEDGSAIVSEAALDNPGQALLIHQVIAPAIASLIPPAGVRAAANAPEAGDVDALRRSVAALQEQVRAQQAAIDALRRNR